MPREYAKNWTTMWTDDDFCNQPVFDKLLWNVLLGQPATLLNNAGVQPLSFKRWRKAMRDGDRIPTEGEIKAALVRMERRGYVYADEDTGELLIRTFIRNDRIAKQPTMFVSALRAAAILESPKLAHVLLTELTTRIDLPDIAGDNPKAEALRRAFSVAHHEALTHLKQLADGITAPLPEPFAEDLSQPLSEGMSQGSSQPLSRPGEIEPSSQGMSQPFGRPPVVVEVEVVPSPPVGNHLGGSRAPAHAHTREADLGPDQPPEPPTRCRKHRDLPPDAYVEEDCTPCGNFRRAHDRWTDEQTAAAADATRQARAAQLAADATTRQAAINNCDDCDPDGRRPNGLVCSHTPGQNDTNARGIARVRAALTGTGTDHA